MVLEQDIVERIRKDFQPAEAQRALDLLAQSGHWGHVARSIVVASRGSIRRMQEHIAEAEEDIRDVIVSAEYEEGFLGRRARDLRVSFLVDAPDKMWIGEVACMMHARGYDLASVETRPATVGPFEYDVDRHEGVARFVSPKGEFQIEKRDRRWKLHGDAAELERYNVHHDYHDETVFRDAVSGYLLTSNRDAAELRRERELGGL